MDGGNVLYETSSQSFVLSRYDQNNERGVFRVNNDSGYFRESYNAYTVIENSSNETFISTTIVWEDPTSGNQVILGSTETRTGFFVTDLQKLGYCYPVFTVNDISGRFSFSRYFSSGVKFDNVMNGGIQFPPKNHTYTLLQPETFPMGPYFIRCYISQENGIYFGVLICFYSSLTATLPSFYILGDNLLSHEGPNILNVATLVIGISTSHLYFDSSNFINIPFIPSDILTLDPPQPPPPDYYAPGDAVSINCNLTGYYDTNIMTLLFNGVNVSGPIGYQNVTLTESTNFNLVSISNWYQMLSTTGTVFYSRSQKVSVVVHDQTSLSIKDFQTTDYQYSYPPGTSFTLSWNVTGLYGPTSFVFIDDVDVTSSSTYPISGGISQNTIYTLRAEKENEIISKTLQVDVTSPLIVYKKYLIIIGIAIVVFIIILFFSLMLKNS